MPSSKHPLQFIIKDAEDERVDINALMRKLIALSLRKFAILTAYPETATDDHILNHRVL